ncbi:VacJ family lipoprotein [Hydrogenophaga sp.]|uniref:MlaA family lipoprotein n=1 Tax=Hydrogenophaga sp. TaxID=1904254 RepID=UPI0019C2B8A3|nr:VacJ family lipoprotein [Hydrogenophaga sp.]MBD3892411.1 VacJ family lipoprotein [Hydrogenophaga sp.]
MSNANKLWASGRALGLACSLALLAGCASGPQAHPRDPLEPLNRSVSAFNDRVDAALLKPVAIAYRDHTPDVLRTGVSNFFSNLSDFWSFINAALQLRPQEAAENFMRFNVNTVLGFGGVLDIASEMKIERTRLDFGQTLGRWGVPSGPYLVLPLLGPSTLRDAAARGVEARGDLLQGLDDGGARNVLSVLRVVDTRANLLRATAILDAVALDRYSFTRDIFLQRRDTQIEALIDLGIGVRDRNELQANPAPP